MRVRVTVCVRETGTIPVLPRLLLRTDPAWLRKGSLLQCDTHTIKQQSELPLTHACIPILHHVRNIASSATFLIRQVRHQ